jgi:hypothetical protein
MKKTVSRAIAKQAKTVKFHVCPETSIRQSLINHHRGRTNPLPQIYRQGLIGILGSG